MEEPAGEKQLRSFGLLVGGAFGVLAVWPMVARGAGPRLWAAGVAALLIVPALVRPAWLRQPHRAWMKLGHLLGWINTRVLLTIFYFLILTPLGMVLRMMGKDPMRRRFMPEADTYRLTREPRPGSHMRHQF